MNLDKNLISTSQDRPPSVLASSLPPARNWNFVEVLEYFKRIRNNGGLRREFVNVVCRNVKQWYVIRQLILITRLKLDMSL